MPVVQVAGLVLLAWTMGLAGGYLMCWYDHFEP
jgi:hypothetical protein